MKNGFIRVVSKEHGVNLTKNFDSSGLIMIGNEEIAFESTRNPTLPKYKKGIRKILLNVRRNSGQRKQA